MKNGLYHNHPADYTIYVVESMVPVIGHTSITGHVENARHEGSGLVADATFEGHTYTVKYEQFGAESFWTIVQGTARRQTTTQEFHCSICVGECVCPKHRTSFCPWCNKQAMFRSTDPTLGFFCSQCGMPEELCQVKVQDTLTAFFAAVSEYVNKHVLTPDDMIVRPICGHPYITKLTPGMSVEDIAFLKSGFCPECAAREAEFEIVAEAEYQLQQAWDSLQAVPAYTEQYQRYHAGLSAFFQVVALLASQEIDPFSLDWETAIEWHELQDTWEVQTC